LRRTVECIGAEEAIGTQKSFSFKESQRVRRLIRDTLEITDSPSSRNPGDIADFIYWNCESLSRDAAERWLRSLTEHEVARLQLGDVLSALAPGSRVILTSWLTTTRLRVGVRPHTRESATRRAKK
jgi:hypothetical protein